MPAAGPGHADRPRRRDGPSLGRSGDELDEYTRAHLVDSRERIARALNAPMVETAATAGNATMLLIGFRSLPPGQATSNGRVLAGY